MAIDTDAFREALLRQREQLQSQIEHHDISGSDLTGETGELVSSSADNHMGDTATETFERGLSYGLEENAEAVLAAIDGALQRIEDGTYGQCQRCGKQIAEERLEALPYAELCIDCKRESEAG